MRSNEPGAGLYRGEVVEVAIVLLFIVDLVLLFVRVK